MLLGREHTSPEDSPLLQGSPQVHEAENGWLERIRTARVVAYRLPEETFVPDGDGFWISNEPVAPLELVELGGLVERHAEALIELRFVPSLWPLWPQVRESTLEFSGIRLRNAQPAK